MTVHRTKNWVVIGPKDSTLEATLDALYFAEELVPQIKSKKLSVREAIRKIKQHPLYAKLEHEDLEWAKKWTRLIVEGIRDGKYTKDEETMYISKILQ